MKTDRGERTGVAESFGRAASRYREHARVQEAMADWLAEWVPSPRTGVALEVGAGPGIFTERLLPWKGQLVASDLSAAMCAAGRNRIRGITWRVMRAEAPEGGPWDWIFSSSMLQWARDPAGVLGSWREGLAGGGRVLAGLFVERSLCELRELVGDGPVRWRTVREWMDAAACAGLRIRRCTTEQRRVHYDSALALWRALHGIGAAPERRIAPARLRQMLHEFDRRHRSASGAAVTWGFFRFEAERAE